MGRKMNAVTPEKSHYVISLVKSVIFYPWSSSFLETDPLNWYILESSFFLNYKKCIIAPVRSIGFRPDDYVLEISGII